MVAAAARRLADGQAHRWNGHFLAQDWLLSNRFCARNARPPGAGAPAGYARLGANAADADRAPAAGATGRTDPAGGRPHDDVPRRDHGAGGLHGRRAAGLGGAGRRQRRRQDDPVPPDARADGADRRVARGHRAVRGTGSRRDPQPPRLHARARLPAARPVGRRHRGDVRGARGPPGACGATAGLRHARPGRPRRGPLPSRRRVLDGHAPAHQARAGARGGPQAGAARRADGRPRPPRPRGHARPGRAPDRLRHLRHPGHAPARRRAARLRARRDDRPRPARARGADRPAHADHRRHAGRGRWAAGVRPGAGRCAGGARHRGGAGGRAHCRGRHEPARLYSLSTRHRSLDDVFMQEARR